MSISYLRLRMFSAIISSNILAAGLTGQLPLEKLCALLGVPSSQKNLASGGVAYV